MAIRHQGLFNSASQENQPVSIRITLNLQMNPNDDMKRNNTHTPPNGLYSSCRSTHTAVNWKADTHIIHHNSFVDIYSNFNLTDVWLTKDEVKNMLEENNKF